MFGVQLFVLIIGPFSRRLLETRLKLVALFDCQLTLKQKKTHFLKLFSKCDGPTHVHCEKVNSYHQNLAVCSHFVTRVNCC